jgi:hypothetical protein
MVSNHIKPCFGRGGKLFKKKARNHKDFAENEERTFGKTHNLHRRKE